MQEKPIILWNVILLIRLSVKYFMIYSIKENLSQID